MDRRTFLWSAGAVLGAPALSLDAFAQTQRPRPAAGASGIDTSELAPGEFIWQPELAPDGPVAFIVSLPDQLVHVYRNGVEIGVSTCSTGKPGHRTPTGVFVILQKDKDHRSSTYNNAPMPNMQRLTWGGIALHAGNLPGYPASHGCVRLPRKFSQLIFEITHLGIPVIIADAKSQPDNVLHPGLLLPADAEIQLTEAMLAAAKKAHHPPHATTSSHDLVSIVVSGKDQVASVLMDGLLLWESPVEILDPGRPLGNHVYKLIGHGEDGRTLEWLAHGIHGDYIANRRTDPALSRIRLLGAEEAAPIFEKMVPGSSLVITDLSAGPDTRSGPDFVIIRQDGDEPQ